MSIEQTIKQLEKECAAIQAQGYKNWHKAEFERFNLGPATSAKKATKEADKFIEEPSNRERFEEDFQGKYHKVYSFFLKSAVAEFDWSKYEKPSGEYEQYVVSGFPRKLQADKEVFAKYSKLITLGWKARGYKCTRELSELFFADPANAFSNGYTNLGLSLR